MLPNFLIIGAAKTGTYSLWSYLDLHPEIFMSRQKELDFFCDPAWQDRVGWYEGNFDEATEPLRGEASVYYSMHPFKPDVAPRVNALLPDAKLIYVVRDPLPRVISAYVQNLEVGYERRPINEAFADLDDPANEYVCSSRYASQLKEYLRFFPLDRILVIDQAELLANRADTIRRTYEFLGADPSFESERFSDLVNTRAGKRAITGLGYRLRATPIANVIRRLPEPIQSPIAGALRRTFDRKIDLNPELDPALREGFIERIRPEIEELRALTGQRFASWSL